MDTSTLVRNPKMVHAILKKQPDGSVFTTTPCKVYFPERFVERNLADISNIVTSLGMLGIVVDDKYYGVMRVPSIVRMQPTFINKVKIEDDSYYELEFEKNSTVFITNEVVKKDTLPYYIYDEMIVGGRIPWYFDYMDILKIFDESVKFSGVRVGHNLAIMDMVASTLCRDPRDLTRYYRQIYTGPEMEKKLPPEILPLKNVSYAATNTTAKLLGSHFSDGLTSALINPSTRQEGIEEHLRR